MDKHSRVNIIFSLLFFSLWTFTTLTLIISQFSQSFSHLFLIFIRPHQLFEYISTFIFFCGFIFGICFIIVSSWNHSSNTFRRVVMLCLSIVLIYLLVLNIMYKADISSNIDIFLLEGSIYHRNIFELISTYFWRIVFVSLMYVFFVYVPLLFIICGIRPNPNNGIGEILYDMRPSINIIIVTLFALALQPYYYRDNLFVYIDIAALVVGVCLLIYVIKTHRELFGFYERINFALLVCGIMICFICTSTLSISEHYYNARYTFLVFVIVGWCVEWMYESISLSEE